MQQVYTESTGYSGESWENPAAVRFKGTEQNPWRNRALGWPFLQDELWAAEQMDYLHHRDSDPENALSARSVWHAEENLGGSRGLLLCHQMIAGEQQGAQ